MYVITKGNWGGAQHYVFDLATNLPKDLFEPAVTCGEPGRLVEKLAVSGIRTTTLSSLSRDISALRDARSFFSLLRLFRAERPHIVHLNSSKAAGIGALAARIACAPQIIVTVHGWPFLEQRNIVSRALIWFATYLTALLSHQVIVLSDFDLAFAERMPFVGKKTIRIYNGIAPLSLGSGETIRNAFPKSARITGTIGELTRNKNQQALIEEARKNPNMFVAIVGEGGLRGELEVLIQKYRLENRVKLFGFIPVNEALRGFDVFALPSLKEGLPYALLEAKLAGLPIVANRVGGVGEILDNQNPRAFTLKEMLHRTLHLYTSEEK